MDTKAPNARRLAALVVLASFMALLQGCYFEHRVVRGNGVLLSEQRDDELAPFDAVRLTTSFDADITVDPSAPRPAVVVLGDENLVPLVTTRVSRGTLVIETEEDLRSRNDLRVEIVTPSLSAVHISGSGDAMARNVSAERFEGMISGSGNLTLAGRVEQVDLSVTGSGSIDARQLEAQAAEAQVTGSGNIDFIARDQAEMTITGSGNIDCAGDPARVKRRVTGSGRIHVR